MNGGRQGRAHGQGRAELGQVMRVDDFIAVRGVYLALAGAAQMVMYPTRVVGRAG